MGTCSLGGARGTPTWDSSDLAEPMEYDEGGVEGTLGQETEKAQRRGVSEAPGIGWPKSPLAATLWPMRAFPSTGVAGVVSSGADW